MIESTVRAAERQRCARTAHATPKAVCPACGRQDVAELERIIRSKEEQIQRLLRAAQST